MSKRSRGPRRSIGLAWRLYGLLVYLGSLLGYGLVSRLRGNDEGGLKWFARRLKPELPAAPPPGKTRIWIHAVSVGESKLAELLQARLSSLDPQVSVVLSAATYWGVARIRKTVGAAASFIMPIDTPGAQRRAVHTIRPDLMVLIESEFWPAHFAALGAAEVPVIVVNGMLSTRSFARHRRWPAVARATFGRAARLYVQSEIVRQRFATLGVAEDCLEVCGNLKLAAGGSPRFIARHEPPTVTFGNVHAAELAALAPAIATLRQTRPGLRIVIVPRHPGVHDLRAVRRHLGPGLAVIERLEELAEAGPFVWVNAMGVLADLYALSQVGVVCGTFAAIGGHDLAEPLHNGAVSLYGPHVARQLSLHAALANHGVAQQVDGATALPDAIVSLLDHPDNRLTMLEGFRDIAAAADRTLSHVAAALLNEAYRQHRRCERSVEA